jgi:protein involved in temperature-dependent protein secretion
MAAVFEGSLMGRSPEKRLGGVAAQALAGAEARCEREARQSMELPIRGEAEGRSRRRALDTSPENGGLLAEGKVFKNDRGARVRDASEQVQEGYLLWVDMTARPY